MKNHQMVNRFSSLLLTIIMVLGPCVSPITVRQTKAEEGTEDETATGILIVAK